jgi:hypothetical protein
LKPLTQAPVNGNANHEDPNSSNIDEDVFDDDEEDEDEIKTDDEEVDVSDLTVSSDGKAPYIKAACEALTFIISFSSGQVCQDLTRRSRAYRQLA